MYADAAITKVRKNDAVKLCGRCAGLQHQAFWGHGGGKNTLHIHHSMQGRWPARLFPPFSYLSLCPGSVSIVSCDWEHFNDRNLVLLNSAGLVGHRCQDIPEAGSLSFWQPCTSVSSALLLRFLSSSLSSFSLLGPPQGDYQRERERESKKGSYMCLHEWLCFCLPTCLMSVRRLYKERPCAVLASAASTALLSVHTGLDFSWWISHATPRHATPRHANHDMSKPPCISVYLMQYLTAPPACHVSICQ